MKTNKKTFENMNVNQLILLQSELMNELKLINEVLVEKISTKETKGTEKIQMELSNDEIQLVKDSIKGTKKGVKNSSKKVPNFEKELDAFLDSWGKGYMKSMKKIYKAWCEEKTRIRNDKKISIMEYDYILKEKFSGCSSICQDISYRGEIEGFKNLEKKIERDKLSKKQNFIKKVTEKVGEITDVSSLEISMDNGINGIVTGELGKVNVSTTFAGGYNVQCLHFRTLFKKIK